jgi:hypothetical protein
MVRLRFLLRRVWMGNGNCMEYSSSSIPTVGRVTGRSFRTDIRAPPSPRNPVAVPPKKLAPSRTEPSTQSAPSPCLCAIAVLLLCNLRLRLNPANPDEGHTRSKRPPDAKSALAAEVTAEGTFASYDTVTHVAVRSRNY